MKYEKDQRKEKKKLKNNLIHFLYQVIRDILLQ